jgi:fatty acid desaturase
MTKDHRSVIASLEEGQRRALTARSNLPGLIHLAGHLGLIALSGALILAQVPGWPILMLPHGILLVFLFTPLHECIHRTAFCSDALNILVADLFGIVVGLQARWFLRFHVTHHRFTNDPERDPELAVDKSGTLASYAIYMSGFRYWQAQVRNLFVNAMGRNRDPFVAGAAGNEIRAEAWRYLAVYGIAIAASFWLGTLTLVWVWLLPLLLGQPFLRAYLLAEHTGCPSGGNMLENSRTTMTNPLVRFGFPRPDPGPSGRHGTRLYQVSSQVAEAIAGRIRGFSASKAVSRRLTGLEASDKLVAPGQACICAYGNNGGRNAWAFSISRSKT